MKHGFNCRCVRVVCVALLMAIATPASAVELSGEFAGSSTSSGRDSNGDLFYASVSSTTLRTNLGTGLAQSLSELGPWDGASFCTEGPAGTIKLFWIEYSEVWTFDARNQLIFALSPDVPSYLCARPDDTWYAVFNGVVQGGSGRFRSAVGAVSGFAEGRGLPNANGHSFFQGSLRGEVTR